MNSPITNASGEKLDYRFHGDASDRSRIVLIGHGVTGNLDRPWAEGLANALAAAGYPALRFSFAGNGDSEGDFRDCTISKEVGDLGSVIDAVKAAGYGEVIYAGHSMGGAVGVLRTAADDRISRLISLAGMVHTAKFCDTEFGMEKPDEGFMWEDEDCPLSSTYVNDMHAIGSVLDKAAAIRVPWLLIHGDQDDVVPIGESREIFAVANEPKQLVELTGVNHVFANEGLQPMIDAVTGWLTR
ncbi:MAG: alpha/beta hydrolase [Verrucomicrobiales bacterium]|nr:alpha/beta hydrolase [Verrucomicrobiales bacterium]